MDSDVLKWVDVQIITNTELLQTHLLQICC